MKHGIIVVKLLFHYITPIVQSSSIKNHGILPNVKRNTRVGTIFDDI